MLQMFYDIKEEKRKESSTHHPDFSILIKILFWDTDIQSIDWNRYYKAVIRRVFERGNAHEKEEIIRFYGLERVKAVRMSVDIDLFTDAEYGSIDFDPC